MALPFSNFRPNLGPRARKVLRYVGFAAVGLISFIIAFQLTFPFDRVKDKLVETLADKYDVTIGEVSGGIMPGRVYFKAVSLRTRPTSADEVASTLYVEQLRIDLGLFALLRGTIAVGLDAKIGPGRIKGDVAFGRSNASVDLVGEDLPSASLPLRELIGLPMSGKLQFSIDADVPIEKSKTGKVGPNWQTASADVELDCPTGCTVGDGKSKLKPKLKNQRNQAFAEGGIDFGKVNIDSLFAHVQLQDGKLRISRFDVKSPDGEARVEFDMAVAQDIGQSNVTGCLRFRGSDALLKREAKTHAAISTTGAPLGPDNLFHIKLDGPLKEIRRLGVVCTAAPGGDGGAGPARPNLTITPEPAQATLPTHTPPAPAAYVPPPAAAPPAAAPVMYPDAGVVDPTQGSAYGSGAVQIEPPHFRGSGAQAVPSEPSHLRGSVAQPPQQEQIPGTNLDMPPPPPPPPTPD